MNWQSTIQKAAVLIACGRSEDPLLLSERQIRLFAQVPVLPISKTTDGSAQRRLHELRRLMRVAGDYEDEPDNPPSSLHVGHLIEHILRSLPYQGHVDVPLPEPVLWLTASGTIRNLCYLLDRKQFRMLWTALCCLGGTIVTANLCSHFAVSKLAAHGAAAANIAPVSYHWLAEEWEYGRFTFWLPKHLVDEKRPVHKCRYIV